MSEENNNKRQPKRIGRKKKTIPQKLYNVDDISKDETGVPSDQIACVEDVIKQAFLRFYDNISVKKHRVNELEHLDALVSEFLGTFMILGYDINGEKMLIMHATNPHDRDALVEHLRTTFIGIINSNNQ
jgi:hypothetical protein